MDSATTAYNKRQPHLGGSEKNVYEGAGLNCEQEDKWKLSH
jgi:hypothetical protein